MITVEDKLEMFRKLLFENIDKHSFEEREALLKKVEEEKSLLYKKTEEKERQAFEANIKKAETRKRQILSEVQTNSYFKILRKKEEFVEEMIIELRNYCEKYTDKKEYLDFILFNLSKALKAIGVSPKLHIALTSKDVSRYEAEIQQCFRTQSQFGEIVIENMDEDSIGGFILEDKKRNLQIDYAISSLIDESRGMIGNIIGQKLDGVIV